MSALIPAEAPPWFRRYVLQNAPGAVQPLALFEAVSTALPDPTKFPNRIISVTDTDTLAVSDGVHWFPLTRGAHY